MRFDTVKGYGFVAPDSGAGDVFIHVNDMLFDKSEAVSGAKVEYVLEDGERGPKASEIRLLESRHSASAPVPSTPVHAPADGLPAQSEDELCDILSGKEYTVEVTESLLGCASLTAEQVVDIRRRLLHIAQAHGWIDDQARG